MRAGVYLAEIQWRAISGQENRPMTVLSPLLITPCLGKSEMGTSYAYAPTARCRPFIFPAPIYRRCARSARSIISFGFSLLGRLLGVR